MDRENLAPEQLALLPLVIAPKAQIIQEKTNSNDAVLPFFLNLDENFVDVPK